MSHINNKETARGLEQVSWHFSRQMQLILIKKLGISIITVNQEVTCSQKKWGEMLVQPFVVNGIQFQPLVTNLYVYTIFITILI
jgi:sRNA-binding regulator protein Hfq